MHLIINLNTNPESDQTNKTKNWPNPATILSNQRGGKEPVDETTHLIFQWNLDKYKNNWFVWITYYEFFLIFSWLMTNIWIFWIVNIEYELWLWPLNYLLYPHILHVSQSPYLEVCLLTQITNRINRNIDFISPS